MYVQKGEAQRLRSCALNLRTLIEAFIEDVLVEPLDALFRTRIQNESAWSRATAALELSLSSAGPFLATALGCSLDALSTDEFCDRMSATIAAHLCVAPDEDLLRAHLSPICQNVDASELLLAVVCRSSLMCQILGTTLPPRLRTAMHCEAFGLQQAADTVDVTTALLEELLKTRSDLIREKSRKLRHVVEGVPNDANIHEDRTETMLVSMYGEKDMSTIRSRIRIIETALRNNIALRNAPAVFTDVFNFVASMGHTSAEDYEAEISKLVSRQTLTSNMLILEVALDELIKAEIFEEPHLTLTPCDIAPPFVITWNARAIVTLSEHVGHHRYHT